MLTVLVLLGACSQSPEEAAAEAAKSYYDCLVEDNPEGFLHGRVGIEDLPSAYCEELLQACRQYQADLNRKHGGLQMVRISDAVGRRDTTLQLVNAFLLLSYGDSTQEEITVPMVEVGGKWRMR